jgi:hypothetical protein
VLESILRGFGGIIWGCCEGRLSSDILKFLNYRLPFGGLLLFWCFFVP